MTQRVLILGGSGFVGRHVVERLQRQGVAMTVPTRRLAAARHLWSQPRVHVTVADVMDPPTLRRLVAEHDAVVNLVAILLLQKPALLALADYEAQRRAGLDPQFHPERLGIRNADYWQGTPATPLPEHAHSEEGFVPAKTR